MVKFMESIMFMIPVDLDWVFFDMIMSQSKSGISLGNSLIDRKLFFVTPENIRFERSKGWSVGEVGAGQVDSCNELST